MANGKFMVGPGRSGRSESQPVRHFRHFCLKLPDAASLGSTSNARTSSAGAKPRGMIDGPSVPGQQ